MISRFLTAIGLFSATVAAPALPQSLPTGTAPRAGVPAAAASALSYADVADLVLGSPVILDATVRSASRIKGAEAANVAPGRTRFYVEADVTSLIRGAGGVPPRIGYVVDLSPGQDGRLPKLKKMRVLAFARSGAAASGQLQLSAPDGQQPWSASLDATVRAVAAEAVSADTPPRITGVGNAFHVPGSLPGEGETQIFLSTADSRPVSLSVLTRPGEQRHWAVALSEVVDEAAAPPRPNSLLWYRLACGLPQSLPDRSTSELAPDDATAAQDDYRFVLSSLGPCRRTRS
jgi:hypothetical protein